MAATQHTPDPKTNDRDRQEALLIMRWAQSIVNGEATNVEGVAQTLDTIGSVADDLAARLRRRQTPPCECSPCKLRRARTGAVR